MSTIIKRLWDAFVARTPDWMHSHMSISAFGSLTIWVVLAIAADSRDQIEFENCLLIAVGVAKVIF